MKTKTTIFYNDTDCASFEATKNYLFETFAEEEGWTSPDDIPDCVVYHEMEQLCRRTYFARKRYATPSKSKTQKDVACF